MSSELNAVCHHGEILKKYLKDHNINRKGGVNGLAGALGLSRQGVYGLFKKGEIKAEYRDQIVKYFDLDSSFFPPNISLEDQLIQLRSINLNLRQKNIELREEILFLKERNLLLKYLDNLLKESIEQESESVIKIIDRNAVEEFAADPSKLEFLNSLPTMRLPDSGSGFAFEVHNNALRKAGILESDLLICSELVLHPEEIAQGQLYVIILKNNDSYSTQLCGFLSYNESHYILDSADPNNIKIKLPFDIVTQLWRVKARFTPVL